MFITTKTNVIDLIGLINLYSEFAKSEPQMGFYLCVLVPIRKLAPVVCPLFTSVAVICLFYLFHRRSSFPIMPTTFTSCHIYYEKH